jgi:hypothetical protein
MSLPTSLPIKVEQLVNELDKLNPPAVIETPNITEEKKRELIFQAGRRSVVEELLRLKDLL